MVDMNRISLRQVDDWVHIIIDNKTYKVHVSQWEMFKHSINSLDVKVKK